jgi:hypothetical protein
MFSLVNAILKSDVWCSSASRSTAASLIRLSGMVKTLLLTLDTLTSLSKYIVCFNESPCLGHWRYLFMGGLIPRTFLGSVKLQISCGEGPAALFPVDHDHIDHTFLTRSFSPPPSSGFVTPLRHYQKQSLVFMKELEESKEDYGLWIPGSKARGG